MAKYVLTQTHKGFIAAILAAIFYGSSGLFVKLAQSTGLGSLDLLTLQYFIAVPFLWFITFIKYHRYIKIGKLNLIKLFFIGTFLTSMINFFYYESFKYLDISIATMLLYTYPILVVLLSFVFLKEKPTKIILFSLIIVFFGCTLVLNLYSNHRLISTTGILLGFGAALGYAIYNMFIEKLDSSIPPVIFVTYNSTFVLLGCILYKFPIYLFTGNLKVSQLYTAALLTFICHIPPTALLYIAIRYIGAVKTSIITNIEIPAAAILGYIFYNETLSLIQLFGMLLVAGGILFMKNGKELSKILKFPSLEEKK